MTEETLKAIETEAAAATWPDERAAFLRHIPALVAEVRRLREALVLAEKAMNHMGDALNEMDAVLPEDETKVAPVFVAVRKALGIVIPGMPE